jgi:hypothetical protein
MSEGVVKFIPALATIVYVILVLPITLGMTSFGIRKSVRYYWFGTHTDVFLRAQRLSSLPPYCCFVESPAWQRLLRVARGL